MKKIIALSLVLILICMAFASCRPATKVSHNISLEADSFNVTRRITVVNMRTDSVMFEVVGTFSLKNNSKNELEIICQVGPGLYKKHYIYLNDWTSYVMEDISGHGVDPYRYEIRIYPQLPSITFGG